jgi:hypothetical protein
MTESNGIGPTASIDLPAGRLNTAHQR